MPIPPDGCKPISRDRRGRPIVRTFAALTIAAGTTLALVPAATATTSAHKRHRHHRHAQKDASCVGADARVGHTAPQVLRAAVVCLINKERTAHHLPALQASPLLNRSAQGWTDSMVSSDQFTHGANFASRISAVGYVWRSAGENIATGFATPRSVVKAWMGSTGHCQNILNPSYRNIGTGVSTHPVKGFATGSGTWTQDFALGMHQSSPSGNYGPMDSCPY
jgi:uncharacterized protein YkwD